MKNKRIQYSIRALIVFAFVFALLAWQVGKLRNQYFIERSNVASLKKAAPNASVEYESIAPQWLQKSRLCPEWLDRVHSVDFIGLLETQVVETASVKFDDSHFLSIKSNLEKFRSLDNLFLLQTQVSDETLENITELTQVKRLDITDCQGITEAGIKRLIEQRPDLKITESVSEGGMTKLKTR